MNWRRGILRIWVAVTACWAALVLILTIAGSPVPVESHGRVILFLIAPPAIIFIIGAVAMWIASGFSRAEGFQRPKMWPWAVGGLLLTLAVSGPRHMGTFGGYWAHPEPLARFAGEATGIVLLALAIGWIVRWRRERKTGAKKQSIGGP